MTKATDVRRIERQKGQRGHLVLGLVSCSAQKLDRPAPARQLYTSPLFRLSLAYAEARCDHVYVLSAFHDVLELDQRIDPYDWRLGSKREREAWAFRVANRVVPRHGRDAHYVILAGNDYARPLYAALHMHGGCNSYGYLGVPFAQIHEPLRGKQIGQRLRWLKDQSGRSAA